MAKEDQWFKFFYKQFMFSTQGWKDDEVGAYLRLLINQFESNGLPDTPLELGKLFTTYKKNWPLLSKKFRKCEDGLLRNDFMAEIRQERDEKSAKGAERGAKGGRPRKVTSGETRFYLIRCFNSFETFYKAGITNETIGSRYNSGTGGSRAMPYQYEILIDEVCSLDSGLALEKILREKFEKKKPDIFFKGHTECYKISEGLIDFIHEYLLIKKPKGFKNESHIYSSSLSDSGFVEGGTGEEAFLIPQMLNTFKTINPKYPIELDADFAALRSIAEKIQRWENLPGKITDHNDKILKRWDQICKSTNGDSHLSKYSLTQLDKYFQSVIQSFNSNGTHQQSFKQPATKKSNGAAELVAILQNDIADLNGPGSQGN